MVNIVFVNPSNELYKSFDIPLGILSLATILKESYNVDIVDFNNLYANKIFEKCSTLDKDIEKMRDYILELNPHIVDFYTMCNSHHLCILLSKKLKEKKPSLKIIFGGPHASLVAEESMKAFPWIDAIGIGEGENTIKKIMDALIGDKDFTNIMGVAYRKNGEIFCNSEPELIKDLDKLPFIDYSLIDMTNFNKVPLDVGRGCPFGCTYCSTKTFWKRMFRIKSSQRILEEIKYLLKKYNIKEFEFVHDIFTANRDKVMEFCDLVIKEKLNIKWSCSARIDTLDEEMVSKMAKSGCHGIYLGIETGSQRMQKIINKNLNLSKTREVVEILKKHNINVTTSFIYGFPDETLEDIKCTLDLIQNLTKKGIDKIQLHLLAVLPGTEVFQRVQHQLEFDGNLSDMCFCKEMNNYFKRIIENHPKIFPQYFQFRTDLREQVALIDKFITCFYDILIKHMPATYEAIMQYYNGDLLQLFLKFKDKNRKLLNTFHINASISKRIVFIENYINSASFGDKTTLIRELFKFELNILHFTYSDKENEKINKYDFDVCKMRMNGIEKESDLSYPVEIKFTRNEDHVNIKRIS